jgi:UDP-2,3-diacylglucosamine hydrolase
MSARPTLFISDLHLSAARPEMMERFVAFLRSACRDAAALYILGDLFDVWIGDDDTANLFNESVLAQLAALTERGVPVFFLPGNRDFLFGRRAAARGRLRLLPGPTVIDLQGERTLLLHGDTLCTGDRAYQRYRRIVQNPLTMALARALPLATRQRIAQALRARSERTKPAKAGAIGDVEAASMAAAFRAWQVQRMIHGHTHRPGEHHLELEGRRCIRWVLPDWYAQGGYLSASAETIALHPLGAG